MANQGSRTNQGGSQGNRDREGNLGQSGGGVNNPTGTSGRQDENRPADTEGGREKRRNNPWDDDSPLGTRNTNR